MRFTNNGCILDKVDQKHRARSERLVTVADDELLLKWGHPPRRLSVASSFAQCVKNDTKLDLNDVIRLEYGRASRAWVLFPTTPPWLCFSLYTTDRSYDYICPDEWAGQSEAITSDSSKVRHHFVSFVVMWGKL